MNRAVILVRHAMPEVTPGLASRLWPLSEAAKEDCVLLAHALPGVLAPTILTSDERKACETATVIGMRRGLDVVVDERLREVDRPQTWDDDYRSLVMRYLGGEPLAGWEPQASAMARFEAAIMEADERLGPVPGDLVVSNHGIALSLWLASVAAIDLVPFWRALTFPDAWRWDPAMGEVRRQFERGLPPE